MHDASTHIGPDSDHIDRQKRARQWHYSFLSLYEYWYDIWHCSFWSQIYKPMQFDSDSRTAGSPIAAIGIGVYAYLPSQSSTNIQAECW